jgi:hypothetical protein
MGSDDNAEARLRITAFLQALQDLGWSEGRNVQIDLRWGGHSPERIAAHARELVQLRLRAWTYTLYEHKMGECRLIVSR